MAYKILLVDDDREIAQILQDRLLREGYEVSLAFDGEEALLKVRQDNPDIILLDLMLPKKNGFEVLVEVRQKFKDKWRPIIIISAQADLDSVKNSYQMEADHYLVKPCTMENVLRGIRTMISLIPLRQEQ